MQDFILIHVLLLFVPVQGHHKDWKMAWKAKRVQFPQPGIPTTYLIICWVRIILVFPLLPFGMESPLGQWETGHRSSGLIPNPLGSAGSLSPYVAPGCSYPQKHSFYVG